LFQRVATDGAGIHADEISGPLALLEMIPQPGFLATFDVTMFPILNPKGLARRVRTNRDGIDLNGDYRNSRSLEIKGHIEALLTLGRFEASTILHEDYEGMAPTSTS
jgi:predicted deacylase